MNFPARARLLVEVNEIGSGDQTLDVLVDGRKTASVDLRGGRRELKGEESWVEAAFDAGPHEIRVENSRPGADWIDIRRYCFVVDTQRACDLVDIHGLWSDTHAKDWRTERLRDAGHSGFGIRLNVSEGDWAVCLQKLPAMELRGHPLVFSGKVRVRRGTGAHLYCNAWGHDAAGMDTMLPGSERRSEPIPADGQGHDLRLELTVPSHAVWLFPQAKTTLPPTEADFDDLSLCDARTGRELLRNGGFEEMAVPTLKDTARLARLREFVRAGRAEIVGGAYTQPILYAIGDEPAVRQFTYGCRAVEESLGVPVKFYAAQEPDMAGQVPQLLKQAGFDGVVYRTHWAPFGAPPQRDAQLTAWIGPDGSSMPAVPAYTCMPVAQTYGFHSGPSPARIRDTAKAGIATPLFSGLWDFDDAGVSRFAVEYLTGWANLCRAQPAQALRGKQLIFSGSIRARQPGAHLHIGTHNEENRPTAAAQSAEALQDNQWRRVEVRFRVPDDAAQIFPQGKISAADGDADFDGLSLKTAGGTEELLPAGSFEFADGKLSAGWSVGSSHEPKPESEVVRGDAADSRRFVRLRKRPPALSYKFATLAEYFADAGKPQAEWRDAFADFQTRSRASAGAVASRRRFREGNACAAAGRRAVVWRGALRNPQRPARAARTR